MWFAVWLIQYRSLCGSSLWRIQQTRSLFHRTWFSHCLQHLYASVSTIFLSLWVLYWHFTPRIDQCYLRTTPSKLQNALAHASSNNYSFGAKLVRGAYVESERKRHSASTVADSEPCIVWNSKDETDHCYDSCASILESRIVKDLKEDGKGRASAGVCLASHNGTSMRKFLGKLREDGLIKEGQEGRLQVDDRLRGRVAFGQLMGTL